MYISGRDFYFLSFLSFLFFFVSHTNSNDFFLSCSQTNQKFTQNSKYRRCRRMSITRRQNYHTLTYNTVRERSMCTEIQTKNFLVPLIFKYYHTIGSESCIYQSLIFTFSFFFHFFLLPNFWFLFRVSRVFFFFLYSISRSLSVLVFETR